MELFGLVLLERGLNPMSQPGDEKEVSSSLSGDAVHEPARDTASFLGYRVGVYGTSATRLEAAGASGLTRIPGPKRCWPSCAAGTPT